MQRRHVWVVLGWLNAWPVALFAGQSDQAPETVPAMNEITGTIQSIDADAGLFRLQTENGFNVEFGYTRKTVCKGIGAPYTVNDLAYKDQVIVRYSGRELIASEIEKRNLQPAVAASSPSAPAN